MRAFIQFIKSQFLPGQCCLCHQSADLTTSLCDNCLSSLPLNDSYCSKCATPLEQTPEQNTNNLLCGSCQKHTPFYNQVFSPYLYKQQMIQLIHQFKYHEKLYLARTLADIFITQYNTLDNNQLPELIIPVPLHIKRLKQRGFNQSREVATYLSKKLGIDIQDNLVKRIKLTKSQRGLTLVERKANIKNAFATTEQSLKNKHVVIFDDVMTTGNTVNEVAKVLKKAGAERIDVWTIARA